LSEKFELVIGKKGEIYTTAELREGAGLVPGGRAEAELVEGKIVIKAKPTAMSLLRQRRIGKKVNVKELEELRRELGEELERN